MKKGKHKVIKNQRSILEFFSTFQNSVIEKYPLKRTIKREPSLEGISPVKNSFRNLSVVIPKIEKDYDPSKKYVNIAKLVYQLLNGRVLLQRLPDDTKEVHNSCVRTSSIKWKNELKSESEENFYTVFPNEQRIAIKTVKYCNICGVTYERKIGKNCPICRIPILLLCMKCNREFKSQRSMRTHWYRRCNPLRYFQCLKCDYRNPIKSIMMDHVRRKHIRCIQNVYCKFCPYKTNHEVNLKKHVRQNHGEVKVKVEKEV